MRKYLYVLVGVLFFVASSNLLAGQKPIVIKYAHQLPESQPVAKQARFFEKSVEKQSNGRIEVQVYPAGQLFGARELFNAVRSGEVEMAAVVNGPMCGAIPLLEIFDVPFLFSKYDQLKKAWYGIVGDNVFPRMEKLGAKWLAPGYYGFTQISNSKRVIKAPEDLKGLKIRAVGPLASDILREFGASSITMGGGEAYMAMARKTVDGSATGTVSMFTRNYHEVQKYVTIMNISHIGIPLLVNLKFWNSLPKDLQQIIQGCAAESAEFVMKETKKMEIESIQGLKDRGMRVHILSPKEREVFKKRSELVKKRWIKRQGKAGQDMVKFIENLK